MTIYFFNKNVFSTSYIPDPILGNEDVDSGVGQGGWAARRRVRKEREFVEEDKLDKQVTL